VSRPTARYSGPRLRAVAERESVGQTHRRMSPRASCYMCESVGTTREHSPPRCLFPESKDLEDRANLRKNLITVPSCADHNPRLSKDDEYFLVIAASNLEGNARRRLRCIRVS
jgi:hypothetical protein